jgi:hypothetical protein
VGYVKNGILRTTHGEEKFFFYLDAILQSIPPGVISKSGD